MRRRVVVPAPALAFGALEREERAMADCPGVLHLAAMADGGLARLRTPGGALTAAEARAVADAAERFGSGVVDLTNRANLQIRGLAPDAGPRLAAALEAAGFRFFGEADRRRNILLDPFSGIDPAEIQDMRPLGEALEARLVAAGWIEKLSPKFSFVLDGGGACAIGATPSDVTALALADGILVTAGGRMAMTAGEREALAAMLAIAEAAASHGPQARAADFDPAALDPALGGPIAFGDDAGLHLSPVGRETAPDSIRGRREAPGEGASLFPDSPAPPHPLGSASRPLPTGERSAAARFKGDSLEAIGADAGSRSVPVARVAPRYGVVATASPDIVAVSLAAPVGRLDARMLRVLAEEAETEGEGRLVLAPWSAVALPGVRAQRADALLARAEAVGFLPVSVAERLQVIACSGAPACERAREPAKALARSILALAAANPGRLPREPRRLHLSACPKGCAGSAPADLLLLGASEQAGWSIHENGSPRAPGASLGRIEAARPEDVLARLRR